MTVSPRLKPAASKPATRKPAAAKSGPTNADIVARVGELEDTIRPMNVMLTELYQTFMVKQPGMSESLLNRMAKVTIDIESGQRTSDRATQFAQRLVTMGGAAKTLGGWIIVIAAVIAAMKVGTTLEGK